MDLGVSHVSVKRKSGEITVREKQSRPGEERTKSEDRASPWRKGKQRRKDQRSAGDPGRGKFKGKVLQSLPGSGRRKSGMMGG